MIFIITPALITLSISNLSNYVIQKYGESYGYISLEKQKRVGLKQIINTLLSIVPIINLLYSSICIHNLYDVYKETRYSKHSFNSSGRIKKASREKKIIDKFFKYVNNRKLIKEQLMLDGADSTRINRELKKIDTDNKYIINNKKHKKYKKLKAMSDAELWLESLFCDISLTEKEKLKLYRKYIKDFYKEDMDIKPKAITKTLKISNRKI